jgi:3-dehydroquinate synthase
MGTHVITEAGHPVSEIVIGRRVLAGPILPERASRRRVLVMTQPPAAATAQWVAERVGGEGFEAEVMEVPDRDGAKTLEVAASCYRRLNVMALTRQDTIVAVGGGAVTDLAGFVAATYLRGVEAVYVPTTLLGAVDAAVGGKTGLNLDGKNLVGVFRHPSRIVIDVEVLDTLPEDLLREGAAEALKAGLIADARIVELYEAHGLAAPLADIVDRAVAVKVAIVSADFRETGKRAWLNYGHTVGHGVELAVGLSHGHAVAVGMVAEAAVSARLLGFAEAERQRAAIAGLGLPVAVSGVDPDEVRRLMRLDKKRTNEGLRMTLLRSIGDPVVMQVDEDAVALALDAIGVT